MVDFRFVEEHCKGFCAAWGRDPWDPVLMFKMVFLQFLYDMLDRQMEEQAAFNLVYNWFLGLSDDDDHYVNRHSRTRTPVLVARARTSLSMVIRPIRWRTRIRSLLSRSRPPPAMCTTARNFLP